MSAAAAALSKPVRIGTVYATYSSVKTCMKSHFAEKPESGMRIHEPAGF